MSINMNNENEPTIDSYLSEKLDLLRETPPRDPQAAARGRERFLVELNSIPELNPGQATPGIMGWFKRKNRKDEDKSMNKTQRFAFSALMAIAVIVVMLFGGAGATAFASQDSLPGDTLYPLKTSLEQTQVRLSGDAYNQAQLHLRFAERRLEEIAALIKSGRFEDVRIASTEFEYYVQQALQSLEVVMSGDPARASQLTEQISAAMLAYVDTLKGVWVSVPEDVRPAVLQAILTTHSDDLFDDDNPDELEFTGVVEAIGANSWQVSGTTLTIDSGTEIKGTISIGDTVKVHATIASDGALVAREIQPHGMEFGGDDNGDDDNDNGDDANDKGDDANDNGDDANDKGDDANDNGNDDNDNGDDANDKGDDANDNGDDANDKGDDANDNGEDGNDGGNDDGDNGGSDNGGSDDGGSDNGGSDNGGSDDGGSDNDGSDNGGSDNGGSDNGGSDDGGGGDNGGGNN